MEIYETGSLWKLSIGHLGDPRTANQDGIYRGKNHDRNVYKKKAGGLGY